VPPDDADDLTWLLFRQCGVIGRQQALRFMSEKALRHRLRSGRWRLAHRAVFVAHNGPATEEQRSWVAVLATDGLLGGLSALIEAGLRGFTSHAVHVLIPAHRRRRVPAGVLLHRTTHLPAADVHPVGMPPCTTAPRSVVDAAQWARSDREARAIIAMSCQQRLVTGADMEQVLARMPKVRRHGLIARTALDASGGSHTITELDFLDLCRRGGLPMPSRQVMRTDDAGRRRYLDADFDEWGVRVEIDGAHHMDVEEWWRDMRRQNDLWVAGVRILRFPAWLVRDRPDDVIAQVRLALMAAGWRPTLEGHRPGRGRRRPRSS